MKKLFVVCLVLAFTLTLCLAFSGMAYAEESVVISVNDLEPFPEPPCKVIEDVSGYGDIVCDIEAGEVGDVVTVTVKPYVLCKLNYIAVNGYDLLPNEEGLYQFALVNGDNVLVAKFILDPDQMGAMGEYVKQAEEDGIKSLFTMKNLVTLILAAISFLSGAGWLWQAIRTSKQNKAFKQLNNDVMSSINANLTLYASNSMAPLITALANKIDNITAITNALGKCMIIAQEDTPQARMAIIEELQKIQSLGNEIGDEIKKLIQQEVDKKLEAKEKQNETLAELEKQNDALLVEESSETTQQDEYGQI